jgi:glycosyltransferase involved in cell wall biosynthesis
MRVGVPANLQLLSPQGGHGRIWSRVLEELGRAARLVEIDPTTGRSGRFAREPSVVLADGHDVLPRASVPIVVQVHEAGWFEPELRDVLDQQFYEYIAKHTGDAVRAATHVITPSAAARRDVIVGYDADPDRVHSVPHGVDAPFCADARGGRATVARARNGEPAPYVLYAATLHPRKNLELVRGAVSALAADGLPHVLVIAGGPAPDRPDSSDLERAAVAELPGAPGRVVRINRPTDAELAGLMGDADAFCLPSLHEGFGLTALEAMACGTPVVVSDRGALPEVVGSAGVVVTPTEGAVTGALRELLTDRGRASQLGSMAAARAREFTWKRTAAGWLDVLERATAEAG